MGLFGACITTYGAFHAILVHCFVNINKSCDQVLCKDPFFVRKQRVIACRVMYANRVCDPGKYDVFVSFRGEDSHNNSTGFLFEALQKKGIDAFRDDAGLNKGESIAPKLLQAIEGSRLFVVVFSKNYASSTWCLRELAHICNCIEISPRHVLPIFYDVGPSKVRKQSGS
ncbi:hypothetical protein JHK87_033670 [Glycine soja]|nr:hypothetical protein JHK87_033670 [Glycine soja]